MTLDNFFIGSEEVWRKEQERRAKEAADKLAADLVARRAAIEAKGGKKPASAGQPPVIPPITVPAGTSMIRLPNGNYAFADIPYQGRILPAVELITQPLDGGKSKTQAQWVEWSGTHPNDGTPVDAELLYQCLLRACTLRDDKVHKPVVQEFTQTMQGLFDPAKSYLMMMTNVKYGAGLDAVVTRVGTWPGGTKPSPVQIPEFTKNNPGDTGSYFVLSQQRPENKITSTKTIPLNAKPVLKELLGDGHEHVGAVFPYFSTRKDSKVRESRFWTPAEDNRDIGERVVALGVNDYDRFDLNASDVVYVNRSALGVRLVEQKVLGGLQ